MSFVNPYNFVSLVGNCNRQISDADAKTYYTGVMKCTLETLTPMFIPRGAREGDTSFFSYDHDSPEPKPVIPGSSIRGVVRGVYEALTNGCLSTADDEQPLYKRTTEPKKPGLLIKSSNGSNITYTLYAAERVMLNMSMYHLPKQYDPKMSGSKPGALPHSFGHDYSQSRNTSLFATGSHVWITKTVDKYRLPHIAIYGVETIVSYDSQKPKDAIDGYVLQGEKYGIDWRNPNKLAKGKHHDLVFIKKGFVANVSEDDYTRLKQVWRLYQTKQNGGVNESKVGGTYSGYMDADPLPVFYEEMSPGSGRFYLSPACITKEVFKHTIKGILETQGGYQPCNKKDSCCEACRLFGMVGDDENSRASRVMFRDALPVTDAEWYANMRQIILGSPKITATEFYMEDPGMEDPSMEDPGFAVFNYDYGVNYTYGHVGGRRPVPIVNPRLRGRKFYWHSDEQHNAPEGTNVNMTQTIRPLKAYVSFVFSVAFNRVSIDELRKLKFALELAFGGEPERYAHKMGHGKPIGYGSVRIKAERVSFYTVNEDLRLMTLPEDQAPDLSWQPKETFPVRELRRMLDWSAKPENVDYPQTNGKIYEWFGNNKRTENSSFTQPKFTYVLPKPLDGSISLPETIVKGQGNRTTVQVKSSPSIKVPATAHVQPSGQTLACMSAKPSETRKCEPLVTLDELKRRQEEQKILDDLGRAAALDKSAPRKQKEDALKRYNACKTNVNDASSDKVKKAHADAEKKLKIVGML